jgi:hypothetical protein
MAGRNTTYSNKGRQGRSAKGTGWVGVVHADDKGVWRGIRQARPPIPHPPTPELSKRPVGGKIGTRTSLSAGTKSGRKTNRTNRHADSISHKKKAYTPSLDKVPHRTKKGTRGPVLAEKVSGGKKGECWHPSVLVTCNGVKCPWCGRKL